MSRGFWDFVVTAGSIGLNFKQANDISDLKERLEESRRSLAKMERERDDLRSECERLKKTLEEREAAEPEEPKAEPKSDGG